MAEWLKLDELWVLLSTAQLGVNAKRKRTPSECKYQVAKDKPICTRLTCKRSSSPAKQTTDDTDLHLTAWQRCLMVIFWGSQLG